MIDYYNNNNKNHYLQLFALFNKYKNLNYEQFIKSINEELNTKYTLYDLKIKINAIRKTHSVTKAQLMKDILKYTLSNNTDEKLKEKVNNIDRDFFYLNSGKYFSMSPKNRNKKENDKDLIDELNTEMDIVIKEEKSIKELNEENKVTPSLLVNVKSNLKYINEDKYIKLLKVNYNIESTSLEELNQILEILNYFINNIENKIYELNFYDPKVDESTIRNFHVSKEEDLSDYYKNNIYRLYAWKVSRLENLLNKYNNLKNIIIQIIQDKHIKSFEKLSYFDEKVLKEDEEFLYDYYHNLYLMKNVYMTSIKSLNKINDKRKKEIEDAYIKKLLLENNN